MSDKIAATPRRLNALRVVRDSRELVKYRVSTADFVVDGEVVGGWDRRTYSDLRRAGMITFTDGKGDRLVRLTKAGERFLKPVEEGGDTLATDSP